MKILAKIFEDNIQYYALQGTLSIFVGLIKGPYTIAGLGKRFFIVSDNGDSIWADLIQKGD